MNRFHTANMETITEHTTVEQLESLNRYINRGTGSRIEFPISGDQLKLEGVK